MEQDGLSGDAHTIYLLSDGTCRTCEQVVRAVLVQFDQISVRLIRKAQVRRPETVRSLIEKAAEEHALVFYTLVYDQARRAIQEAAREHLVPVVDLLGPVLTGLYDLFSRAPRAKPGILYNLNKERFDRIDSVEYTLHHDDGCGINELGDADVVLVGVSRSCKSTTCFYLGYSGIRAANVPLFVNADPPPELLKVDLRRVIGLTTNPHRLRSVREARMRGWGMDVHDEYGDRKNIARELRAAHALMEKHGWRCVDTSYKAIEEIAREVLTLLKEAGIDVREREGESGETE
ncbi:MAG: kinase/pyrophosphorylase [Planctomycetes bacterium]|nr:kinase/pyrophosphorylase [Planctomycetota bacterium]